MNLFAKSVLTLAVSAAIGCSSPAHMRVYEGASPQNQDKEVVFRTTYYFRVFDHCADDKAKAPLNQALYRYRMTGKANVLANQIRFESGVLTADQIDPFGATVRVNEGSGGSVVSQEQAVAVTQTELLAEHYDQLTLDRKNLLEAPEQNDDLIKAIEKQITDIIYKRTELLLKSLAVESPEAQPIIANRSLEAILSSQEERNAMFNALENLRNLKAEFTGQGDNLLKAQIKVKESADKVLENAAIVSKYYELHVLEESLRLAEAKDLTEIKNWLSVAEKEFTKLQDNITEIHKESNKYETSLSNAMEDLKKSRSTLDNPEKPAEPAPTAPTGSSQETASSAPKPCERCNVDEAKEHMGEALEKLEELKSSIENISANTNNESVEVPVATVNEISGLIEKIRNSYLAAKDAMRNENDIPTPTLLKEAQEDLSEAREEYATDQKNLQTQTKKLTTHVKALLKNQTDSVICKPNAVRRGFQVLGPEGWRTFDQDERLIMAMHSKATPMISTMKELSSRVTNATGGEKNLIPLLHEQINVSEAIALVDELDTSNEDVDFDKLLEGVITKMEERQ